MNKNIMKTLVAGLACVTICGTALAAPGRGHGGMPQRAPVRQQAPAPRGGGHVPAPHHAPAPERHHTPPPPERPHECHPGGHRDGGGWAALGATLIGGVVGGIVGACR